MRKSDEAMNRARGGAKPTTKKVFTEMSGTILQMNLVTTDNVIIAR